jgi:hypothetical protein
MTMTIAVCVKDEEVEKLLLYLDSQKHLSLDDKRFLIERVTFWLGKLDVYRYPTIPVVTVVIDGNALFSGERADTSSPLGQREHLCQKQGEQL